MTIFEAISRTDNTKPSTYTQEQKIAWLSELDGKIRKDIIDTHDGGADTELCPYSESDLHAELIVPFPYDDIYIRWLESCIDYANGEIGKYNNSTSMFNAKLSDFSNYYNRNHMPNGKKIKYF